MLKHYWFLKFSSATDSELNTSISSLTEHMKMLESVHPFERKYVNISDIEDIEEKMDCVSIACSSNTKVAKKLHTSLYINHYEWNFLIRDLFIIWHRKLKPK